jgi:hypothetical protein
MARILDFKTKGQQLMVDSQGHSWEGDECRKCGHYRTDSAAGFRCRETREVVDAGITLSDVTSIIGAVTADAPSIEVDSFATTDLGDTSDSFSSDAFDGGDSGGGGGGADY